MSLLSAGVRRCAPGRLAGQDQAPNRREFTLTARNYRFTPDRVEVQQDDLVKLTVQSADIAYSFTIDDYRVSKRVPAGGSTDVEFRADRAGTFAFYSNLTNDARHAQMSGRADRSRKVAPQLDSDRFSAAHAFAASIRAVVERVCVEEDLDEPRWLLLRQILGGEPLHRADERRCVPRHLERVAIGAPLVRARQRIGHRHERERHRAGREQSSGSAATSAFPSKPALIANVASTRSATIAAQRISTVSSASADQISP